MEFIELFKLAGLTARAPRRGAALAPALKRVSEAQSAVVNDSPVDCQSRRPGRPQAVTGGVELFMLPPAPVCALGHPPS